MRASQIFYEIIKYATMVFGVILAVGMILLREKAPTETDTFLTETVGETAGITGETGAEQPSPSIRVPHCGDISYDLSSHTNDFSFSNPDTNTCLLRISITRRDTSETVYDSPLISPGSSVAGVKFHPEFSVPGDYGAMIKIDAYLSEFGQFPLVNSMVIDTTVHVQ